MRKPLIAAAVAATAVLGVAQDASAATPCRDLAPREAVVRVHLACHHAVVDPPQRLDLVITRSDAPARWKAAWGGDGSMHWALQTLQDAGCGRIVFTNGDRADGHGCDY